MEELIKALQILSKYTGSKHATHCEHDVLYVTVDPSLVSDEDKKKLDEMGFFVDSEFDCFASFRHGSC